MITVRLNGGLGNQMFQYATAKAIAIRNNAELVLDINEFNTYELRDLELDKYNIKAKIENKSYLIKKILKKFKLINLLNKYYIEKNLQYNNLDNIGSNTYLEGYFQCEKYFENVRDDILHDFTIKQSLSIYTKCVKEEITTSTTAISLHIRRGDYISDSNTNSVHGTCNLDYYKQAMTLMNNKFNDIKYFIFSDDIIWCKENLKRSNAVYIESEEKRIPHEDIYLMSLCTHNIIANSSFSWWGAWLNQNSEKIVIAPKRWFNDNYMNNQAKDIVCESWIRI